MAVAMEWVSRITAVALEMVLPGLAGHWLDQRWGTRFLALTGFALGVTAGIWHLLVMTRTVPGIKNGQDVKGPPSEEHEAKRPYRSPDEK
ncbi:MAG: AtpZ/AtpI family protein [Pirellulales bacterium]|jgi:hypothetical protein